MSGCDLLGHLGRCKWSGDWRGAQGLPAKGPTQVIVETVGAGARSQSASAICWGGVSTVIGSSDFVFLLSTRCEVLASVESLIALQGKNPNSENGVLKLGRRAGDMALRSAAIGSAAPLLLLALTNPVAAMETVAIGSCYDGDTCRTIHGERIRLACIDTPELRGKRAQPERARDARDHLRGMVVGRSVGLRRIMLDRYGRTVGELFVDGRNVQQAMVASRHAEIYWKYASLCPWTR